MRIARRTVVLTAAVALVFGAGPTVGDVGACGTTATDLDESVFASEKKGLDCRRCHDCAISTSRCMSACDPRQPSDFFLPTTCHPLAHDGDVCLHALESASCSDYAGYEDDLAPTTPSECDFCLLVPDGGTE